MTIAERRILNKGIKKKPTEKFWSVLDEIRFRLFFGIF